LLFVFEDGDIDVSTETLKQTPLYDWHIAAGGRMVDFAGWSMPIQYASIIDEHNATRQAVGVFDVSHMGRLLFKDPGALEFLDALTTRRVARIEPGKIRYSLMINDRGGILDDVLVYHLERLDGTPFVYMVVNASNREKIMGWLHDRGDPAKYGFSDRTCETAMIAVQGPQALECVAELISPPPSELKYYTGCTAELDGAELIVSRTGYTGEDGCEIIASAEQAVDLWRRITAGAESRGGRAAGLGARDTLRLEAAMPLYGQELTEQINPAQADIGFAMNLKNRQFIGRDAILAAKQDDSLPVRIGLELEGKRAARGHCSIFQDEVPVGQVTSGIFSPTLQKSIAMGFVQPSVKAAGTTLQVEVRGRRIPATVVPLPFYSR